MSTIKNFLVKWIIPIGFIELLGEKNDNLFSHDSVGESTYWRISESKKKKGAGILIRRS